MTGQHVNRRWPDLGGGTIGGLLAARAAANPAKTALVTSQGQLTYRELDQAASRVGAGLLACGARFGESVGLLLSNRAEYVTAWLGAVRAGLVEVPVNTAYKGAFLDHALAVGDVRVLITETRLLPSLRALTARPAGLRTIVVLDAAPDNTEFPGVDLLSWADLLDRGDPGLEFPAVSPADTAAIMLTSGTTGRSKGVVVPHLHNLVGARENVAGMGTQSSDRLYTCLPMFHGAAQINMTLHALYAGATIILGERFSASRFWDEIRDSGATLFNALGSMLPALLAQPPSERDTGHAVRRVFAAPAPPEVLGPFEERFGVHIVEGYGITEIKNVTYNPLRGRKIGSVGKPTATSVLEIHDDLGNQAPPGEVGEIVYRPTMANIMFKRYIGDPEGTLATMSDLWWHTGDLGYADEDGFLYFVDRKKDALRRRGENISSHEVEMVLESFPGVLEAAAVGVPSPLGEDDVLAVLTVAEPDAFDLKALFSHCDQAMPYFMVPRYYRLVDAMPRTPTGKLTKGVLRSQGLSESTWDSQSAGLTPTRNR